MTDPRVLDADRRPLTEKERRLIRAKIGSLTARGRRASAASLPTAGGAILVLWLLTSLASDTAWYIITAFWLIVGAGIALWVRRDMRKHGGQLEQIARGLESALRRNAADVYAVRARSFAELEEIEDEGACYAFELDGNRLVFITGQGFYKSARFPSLDFSLVNLLDEAGQTVDTLIEKRGTRAAPARRISAEIKRKLNVPEHLEVRTGTVDSLEDSLGLASSHDL